MVHRPHFAFRARFNGLLVLTPSGTWVYTEAMPRNVYWEMYYHLVWRTKESLPLITPAMEPLLHKYLIHRALEMSPEERRLRMQRMRAVIKERNVYRWAGNLIGDLCEVRTSSKVLRPALVHVARSM